MKEIDVQSQKIEKLIHKIEEGDIKIPAFQRGFVWEQTQVIDLLDSIYRDYPIGSLLFWNTRQPLNSVRNVADIKLPRHDFNYPVNYVLDGQQRLSSLYAVFCNKKKIEKEESDVNNPSLTIFDIYFDVVKKCFLTKGELPEKEDIDLFRLEKNDTITAFISMNSVFDIDEYLQQIEKLPSSYRKTANDMLSKFKNYDIPIITIKGNDITEVGVIFERINNTGVKLTTLDLKIAQSWNDDLNFDLRKKFNTLLNEISQKNFIINEKNLLQCLCAVIKETAKTKDILELTSYEIIHNFSKFEKSLKLTIDYIYTNFKICDESFLPQAHQIVGLCYFFSKKHIPTTVQKKAIKQWFWLTSFSKRYSNSTDEKMNEDINSFKELLSEMPKEFLNKYFKYIITSEIFKNEVFTRGDANPYTRSFLLMLAQKEPRSLLNHTKIDVTTSLSRSNTKEYHHIFPQAYLKKKRELSSKINMLANICMLPSVHNKKITDKEPSRYLFTENNQLFNNNDSNDNMDELIETLKSNLMPIELEVYKNDNYEKFIDARSKILYDYYLELIK